jgi:molybdopterin-binding protein
VHQKPYIFRERARDNVAYGLKVRKVPRDQWDERITESLQAVGLADFAHRHGHALSGGERQRLALARALALRPDLLLLDEPTSNIDPDSVHYIETAITRARAAGMTILLSTHNLATAYRIADVVIPMERGSLRRDRNNVYHGSLVDAQTAGSGHADETLARFTFHRGAIVTPALDGAFTAAVVPMDDVILSRGAVASSAQNAFSGTVVELEPFDGLVRVGMDCGFPLSALVTQNAVDQLHIAPGAAIHASFKASAVRLY